MSKTSKITSGIIIAAIVIAAIWVAARNPQPQNQAEAEKEPVKIGAVLPLTGEAASYGQAAQRGIDLAVEKLKEEKGMEIEVIYEDDQIDPKKAVDAFQKLANLDGVKYIIGFGSGETLAMCPIAESSKTILLSAGSSAQITNCGDYTFRNFPSDTYQSKVLADKIYAAGYFNAAVLYINNDYGVGLKKEFEKNFKGRILAEEALAAGGKDFKTQLAKINSEKPEVIVLISHIAEGETLLKQKSELGIEYPVFASDGLKDDSIFKDANVDSLKNLYVIFASQYEGEEYQEYKNAHIQKHGEGFGVFSDYVYDNVLTLADAIQRCGSADNVEAVKSALYQTEMKGATGLIKFDKNGDVIDKDYSLYKVENGKFILAE